MPLPSRSIGFRLNLLLVLVVTTVLAISGVYSYLSLQTELELRFHAQQAAVAGRLQPSLAAALWNFDTTQTAALLDAELKASEVLAIEVYQRAQDKSFLFCAQRKPGGAAERLSLADGLTMRVPIFWRAEGAGSSRGSQSGEIGYALVRFSRAAIDELLWRQLSGKIAEILTLNVLLWLLLSLTVDRVVLHPLRQLLQAFTDLANEAEVTTLKAERQDEFGAVVRAFNHIETKLVSDIERRKQAEAELRSEHAKSTYALQELQRTQASLVQAEKMASLGGLVAGVAHEINTPVGIAVTSASFLLEESRKLDAEFAAGQIRKSAVAHFIATAQESSQLVLSNLERAANLVQSFKQVAVDETSDSRRVFDLQQYIGEVLTSLRPKFKKTAISVQLDCAGNIAMDTFPGGLAQVLTNLLMNSLMHAFDAGSSGLISIVALRDGDTVQIECSDNGKGIAAEHLAQIFDPFFTTKRGHGGTGLGLNIVYNIVTQRLGGEIHVASQLGAGTRFTIRIPAVAPVTGSEEDKA